MQEKPELQRLNTAYRNAWRHYVIAVSVWLAQEPNDPAVQQFAHAAEEAESLYRKSRNALADCMILKMSNRLSNAA